VTGLIPYNPDIVISKLREVPIGQNLQAVPPPESIDDIPTTIASLRMQGEDLLGEARDMSPDFQERLKLVLQGGLVLAQTGALAIEHMENIRAADEARNARHRAHNRRQIQKGGVLYASEARQMVKTREDTEAEKAQKQLHKAQVAKKRIATAAHKPFLDEIKAAYKARCARQAQEKRRSRQQARSQN